MVAITYMLLVLLFESEIDFYAKRRSGIRVVRVKCPCSKEAKFKYYKDFLDAVEEKLPETKRFFYEKYSQISHIFKRESERKLSLRLCSICNMPTAAVICAFCKTWRIDGE